MKLQEMFGRRSARAADARRWSRRLCLERLEDRTVLSTWVEQGPGPILGGLVEGVSTETGAVEAITTDPQNADIVFVGAVNGGVWKTTNATAASPSWTPLTDLQLPGLSINSLAISPVNSNILFAGTGSESSFSEFAANPGLGLARSTDGGSTWALFASDTLALQNLCSVVPTSLDGGNVVLVATEFVADARYKLLAGDAGGVYRSTDNGEHFTRISGGAGTGLPDQAVSDLVADPSDRNRFYAAVPAPYTSAPTGHEGVYKSEDGGLTWAPVNAGFTGLNTSLRILLAVHNSPGSDVLYADVIGRNGGLQGVFRSADLGANWASMGLPSIDIYPNRQGKWQGAVVADPRDPNVVFISGDGDDNSGGVGETGVLVRGDASKQNPWTSLLGNDTNKTAPHPDSRVMVFDANGNILQGDDGGIYRLVHPNDKANRRWVDVNGNLATVEFHSVAYDPVSNIIFGGTQDNGASVQTAPGSFTWTTGPGDGGDVAVDADQAAHPGTSIRYSSHQFLHHFIRQTVNANNVVLATDPVQLKIVAGAGKGKHLPEFDPGIGGYQQFVLNTIDPSRMLIGTTYLYESFDRGDTLVNLGSVGAFVGGSAGFQIPAGRALAYGGRLNGVAYPDVIYAGAGANPDSLFPGSGASIFHRVHVGDPLTRLSAYPGDEVVTLVVDPQDYRRVYTSDINNRVWASFDEGATWSELTANLGALNPYAIGTFLEIYSPSRSTDEDVLVVGTLGGVFEMAHPDQPGAQWTLLGAGLPHTSAGDIHYDYTDNVLLAGTLGRGAWTLANPFADGGAAPVSDLATGSQSPGIDTSGLGTIQLPITIPSGPTAGAVIWLNENAARSDTGFTTPGVPGKPRRINPFTAERPVVWHSVNSGPTDLGAKAGNGPVPQSPPALPNYLFGAWLADDGTFNLLARKKLSKSARR
jgi:hypothetical protein